MAEAIGKSMSMHLTRRENFLRSARRQTHQWITLDFGMAPNAMDVFHAHAGKNARLDEYFNFDGRWLAPLGTRRVMPDWRKLYFADAALPDGARIDAEWGTAHVDLADTDDATLIPPLRNAVSQSEVDTYPWPDVDADYRYEGIADRVKSLQDAGYPVLMGGVNFFESVWGLRGFEQLMMDMAEGSEVAIRLFHKMSEVQVRCAEQIARCGADVLQTGSDVAEQRCPLMSSTTWRQYIFPMMKECINAARRISPDILVLYHSCGNVSSMIEGFIEAGVDILDPCQPEAMDIFAMKKRYGKILSFHGGIGVQSVLPFGTPQEVRDTVRRTIDIMADGGGYLCSSSHCMRQEIPWANILAMVETVREYGLPPA